MTNPPPISQPITSRPRRLLLVYRTALVVLARYGRLHMTRWARSRDGQAAALEACHRRSAQQICHTITRVGGLFVKVGQLISALNSLVPASFRQQLETLQDALPARPMTDIEARIQDDLGDAPARLFAHFEPTPLASASLAQVHRATLTDGREVAVKVQHRDIETLAEGDLRTMRRLVGIAQVVLRVRGLRRAFDEVRTMILDEIDFAQEADQLTAFAAVFADDPMIGCPEVVAERSGPRVLTTTFVDGIKITELAQLDDAGIDRRAVAERLVHAYSRMIFEGGTYHADPHPGNILVRPDGGLTFLDFGAVSRLSPALTSGLPILLRAVLRRDHEAIVRALADMGFVARGNDRQRVAERLIDHVYGTVFRHVEAESWNLSTLRFDPQMKMDFLDDLGRLDLSFRDLTDAFQVPREWIALQRTLALLVGLATTLDPQMQPMTLLRPYVEDLVQGDEDDWVGFATRAMKDLVLSALSVPGELRQLLRQAGRGTLRVEVGGTRERAAIHYHLGQQLICTLLLVAGGAATHLATLHDNRAVVLGAEATMAAATVGLLVSWQRGRRIARRVLRRPPA